MNALEKAHRLLAPRIAYLLTTDGFTVSVPHVDQLEGVWKLGAKYSHYLYSNNTEKIIASGLSIDHGVCDYGPYIGQIAHVHFNPTYLNPDGTPRSNVRPVMQITGNAFTTAANMHTIPYYHQGADSGTPPP